MIAGVQVPVVFESDAVKQGVKYLNVVGLPVLIMIAGLVHLARRRRRASLPWRMAGAEAA